MLSRESRVAKDSGRRSIDRYRRQHVDIASEDLLICQGVGWGRGRGGGGGMVGEAETVGGREDNLLIRDASGAWHSSHASRLSGAPSLTRCTRYKSAFINDAFLAKCDTYMEHVSNVYLTPSTTTSQLTHTSSPSLTHYAPSWDHVPTPALARHSHRYERTHIQWPTESNQQHVLNPRPSIYTQKRYQVR